MTRYHLDDRSIDLAALRTRLETSDLIPSQEPLLDGLDAKLTALRATELESVADLRAALKSQSSLASLSAASGVDPEYLRLLKRAVGGFFPKPRPLSDVDWLDSDIVSRLKEAGITNTQTLFDAASNGTGALATDLGADANDLSDLVAISDLCRIQWVSPKYARALLAAGHASAVTVARADPEALVQAIATANQGAKFYGGEVGLRDVRRLVAAAAYIPQTRPQPGP
ncbi:DUF4332 domain-containing protein [Roseospira visakhapatnamensis]|uniref:Lambda repressor-like predicted transcriptional regulator n=1 Tax=Roseospira visakhapatnamensis TaxID=390880 RepID=A0A7W6RBM6_9PROT|nr:lambda repressor-like predicted transcriptional regulator [Roseospira visakhapatnamensis]